MLRAGVPPNMGQSPPFRGAEPAGASRTWNTARNRAAAAQTIPVAKQGRKRRRDCIIGFLYYFGETSSPAGDGVQLVLGHNEKRAVCRDRRGADNAAHFVLRDQLLLQAVGEDQQALVVRSHVYLAV